MADLEALIDDLRAEGDYLDSLVSGVPPSSWNTMTLSAGWTITHQIAHLCWTDEVSLIAITDAGAFNAIIERALLNIEGFVDAEAEEMATVPVVELLPRWRQGRQDLADALAGVPAGTKLPWFGPPMSAASMATARLMETFAHGIDVGDTLGVEVVSTNRLKHICHIGVRTRDFAYSAHQLTPPEEPFRYELNGPDGDIWEWGPEDATNRVVGPALDFCLLVTQRRHIDDLRLQLVGDDAVAWSRIAQAFAGPPGAGRPPRQ